MIAIETLREFKECVDFLRDNLNGSNLALVYEVVCRRYGHVILDAFATLLLSCR